MAREVIQHAECGMLTTAKVRGRDSSRILLLAPQNGVTWVPDISYDYM